MGSTLKLKTTVLEGNRVEFSAPELPIGAEVEVNVSLPDSAAPSPGPAGPGVADYLLSLPPVARSADEWMAVEEELRGERPLRHQR
jgi:hypothetical protein